METLGGGGRGLFHWLHKARGPADPADTATERIAGKDVLESKHSAFAA